MDLKKLREIVELIPETVNIDGKDVEVHICTRDSGIDAIYSRMYGRQKNHWTLHFELDERGYDICGVMNKGYPIIRRERTENLEEGIFTLTQVMTEMRRQLRE